MPFDPSTATLAEPPPQQSTSTFDPSTARLFDPSTAQPVDEDKPVAAAPAEKPLGMDDLKRVGKSALAGAMRDTARLVDIERSAEHQAFGPDNELLQTKYLLGPAAEWLKKNAPENPKPTGAKEKLEDIGGGFLGGLGPGIVSYTAGVPMAVLQGMQTAKEMAAAEGRKPTGWEMAKDALVEGAVRKAQGIIGESSLGRPGKAIGFGMAAGAQDAAEGRDTVGTGTDVAINAGMGALFGGKSKAEIEAAQERPTPQPGQPTVASAAPSSDVPQVGERVGLTYKNAPSQGVRVESYFDGGNSVRLRHDDGRAHDMLTSEFMRDKTDDVPPPSAEPTDNGPARPQPSKQEIHDFWAESEAAADAMNAKPQPGDYVPLTGGDVMAKMQEADRLERTANDPMSKMTDAQRVDFRNQADQLRQKYGRPLNGGEAGITPDDMERAKAAQEARDRLANKSPDLLDQGVPNLPRGQTHFFTPEEIAAGQQALAQRQSQQADASRNGQLIPTIEAPYTKEELAADAAQRQAQADIRAKMQQGVEQARAEQAGVPQAAPAPDETTAQTPEIAHRPLGDASAYTATGRSVPVTYALVDANDLNTSHDDHLRENPNYPQAIQPRDRTRAATEFQIRDMLSHKFQPERLGPSPDAADGAPIIGPDGVVESGNMRTIALRRAYEQNLNAARQYRQFLENQGYPTEGMTAPMLVRINRQPMTMDERAQFAVEANKPAQLAMSATEQALADASRIPDHVMDMYQAGGDFTSASNRPFVQAVLKQIAGANEYGKIVDADGRLSPDGMRRIQGAVLGKAYGDPTTINRLVESTDSGVTAIGKALTDAAPAWAKLRAAVARGEVPPELDLTNNINDAVNLIAQARQEGRNVVEYVKQRDMLSGGNGVPPQTEAVLRWMLGGDDFSRRIGQAKMADTISRYADAASKVEAGPNLLGAEGQVDPVQLADQMREKAHGNAAQEGQQSDIFRPMRQEISELREHPELTDDQKAVVSRIEQMFAPEPNVHETRDAVHDWAASKGVDMSDPHQAHKALADWLLERSHATGHEYMTAYDTATNKLIDANTENHPTEVGFTPTMGQRLMRGPATVNLQHNHPISDEISGLGLSAEDLHPLDVSGGTFSISAHGGDGHTSTAWLTPEAAAVRDANKHQFMEEHPLITAAEHARDSIIDAMEDMVRNKIITADQGNAAYPDLQHRSLAAHGVLDYITSRPSGLSPHLENLLISKGADAARPILKYYGLPTKSAEDVRLYRPPAPVQPDEAVAEISRRSQEAAAGRSAGANGDAARPENGGAQPAVGAGGPPEQLKLLAPQDRLSGPSGTPSDEEKYRSERAGPVYATRAEQPQTAPLDHDPQTDLSQQIANNMGGGKGPGIYAQNSQLPPRSSDRKTVSLGYLEQYYTLPYTLAQKDWRSGRYWNAVDLKEKAARTFAHIWSQDSQSYAALSQAQKDSLHAVEELDRLTMTVRPNDGRSIVARNEDTERAAFTRPGQTVILDPQTTAAYHDQRALMKDIWTTMMQATARKLWPRAVDYPGTTDPQEIAQMAMNTQSKQLAHQLMNVADLMQEMSQHRNVAYTPFMRFGDYYVAVKPVPGTSGQLAMNWDGNGYPPSAHFALVDSHEGESPLEGIFGKKFSEGESPPAAQAKINELKEKFGITGDPNKDGYEIEEGYLNRKQDQLRKLDIPALEKLFIALDQTDSKLYGPMVEQLQDKLYRELKAGFKQEAKNVPGYSTDFTRVRGAYINWTANHAASLLHGDDIRDMREQYIDTHPNDRMRRFWQRWDDYMNNPAEDMGKLRQFGFYWQMAMNPSSTLLVGLHGPLVAHATLGVGTGMGAAGKALYGAYGEATRALKADMQVGAHIDMNMLGHDMMEKALIRDAVNTGLVHEAMAEDMSGRAQGENEILGVGGNTWQRALKILSSNVAVMDQLNRVSTLLGAYRLAKMPGMMDKINRVWGENEVFRDLAEREGGAMTPETFAKFAVDQGLFVWGKRNRAQMMRGAGALLFQFKNFEVNYLSSVWKMMTRMGPEGKVAGTLMLGAVGLMGGLYGLPFADDAKTITEDLMTRLKGIDPMIEAKMMAWMESGGMSKTGAEAVLHGPSRYFGLDLGSRVGMGDVLTRNLSPAAALGTVPSMAYQRLSSSLNRFQNNQPLAGLSDLLPTAARNAVRGFGVMPQQGIESQYGNPVLPPNKVKLSDEMIQGAGFQTAKGARAYAEKNWSDRLAKQNQELRQRMENQIAELGVQSLDARQNGTPEDVADLTKQIQGLYQEAARQGVDISRAAVSRNIMRRTKPEAAEKRKLPKRLRGEESPFPEP